MAAGGELSFQQVRQKYYDQVVAAYDGPDKTRERGYALAVLWPHAEHGFLTEEQALKNGAGIAMLISVCTNGWNPSDCERLLLRNIDSVYVCTVSDSGEETLCTIEPIPSLLRAFAGEARDAIKREHARVTQTAQAGQQAGQEE
jgi:hypothetical protein